MAPSGTAGSDPAVPSDEEEAAAARGDGRGKQVAAARECEPDRKRKRAQEADASEAAARSAMETREAEAQAGNVDATLGAEPSVFSESDAKELAALARRVGRAQAGVALGRVTDVKSKRPLEATPNEKRIARRYQELMGANKGSKTLPQLHLVKPELLGLHAFAEQPEVLTRTQVDDIFREVVHVLDQRGGWQRRGAHSHDPASGQEDTQRRTFGCELSDHYEVVGRSEMPRSLRELGKRLLDFCRTRAWPYSHSDIRSDIASIASFDQAYMHRYVPGKASATLGYHFDSMKVFDELIVGVTLTGSGHLLLRKTNACDFLKDARGELDNPQTLKIPLEPLSFYAMTGMSRYHLRHAVACGGSEERISVTFRALKPK